MMGEPGKGRIMANGFDEHDHPRDHGGQFSPKVSTEAGGTDVLADDGRAFDARTLLNQIGGHNMMAISGGRVSRIFDEAGNHGIRLPVSNGYSVDVVLAPNDTYTVRRQFIRSGTIYPKGEMTDVYFDQVGETAYQASCFHNGPFGDD